MKSPQSIIYIKKRCSDRVIYVFSHNHWCVNAGLVFNSLQGCRKMRPKFPSCGQVPATNGSQVKSWTGRSLLPGDCPLVVGDCPTLSFYSPILLLCHHFRRCCCQRRGFNIMIQSNRAEFERMPGKKQNNTEMKLREGEREGETAEVLQGWRRTGGGSFLIPDSRATSS